MLRIFKNYFALSRISHIFLDLLVAGLITYFAVDLKYVMAMDKVVPNILDWTRLLIPALSVQAGLHSTSLAFFANSNSTFLTRLREENIFIKNQRTKYKKIDQIFSYFSWAILIQLVILGDALVNTFYLPSHNIYLINYNGLICNYYALIFGGLYAIVLSIRNIGLLYATLTAAVRQPKE